VVRLLIVMLSSGVVGAAPAPAPAERDLAVEVRCPRRDDPGRVVCELSLSSQAPGALLFWADALVVQAPAFVRPLRSRIKAELPEQGSPTTRLSAAFVARELGRAEVALRARAVLCARRPTAGNASEAPLSCSTVTRALGAELVVGPSPG